MKETPDFFMRNDVEMQPYEAALEWLLSQNLKPNAEIYQRDITDALGMVDPDSLGSRDLIRKWELARIPQVELLLFLFEEKTGLIVAPTYKGSYLILEPDEVAETYLQITFRRVRKSLAICAGKLSRASRETASAIELQRRSRVSQYVNNIREFMNRERRKSLDDEAA